VPRRCAYIPVLLLTMAGLLGAGCRSNRAAPPVQRPPTTTGPVQVINKPAIDLSRGGASFPLDTTTAPQTIDELVAALTNAYTNRLEDGKHVKIAARGESVHDLDTLDIDLTNSAVKASFAPKEQPKSVRAMPFMNVGHLRYVADPLKYQHYAASMVLQAENAELALVPGEDQKLGLSLVDCSRGSAHIHIDVDDLRESITAGAKLKGTKAFAIEGIELSLRSDFPRSIEAELLVKSRVLLIPAKFKLTGRADVDADFNVRFSNLNAQGQDPSGALIAGVVQGKLDKLNNKAAPLLKLPGDRIRVTDLKLTVDQSITIDVKVAGSRSE
jgi:hypothetical protein